MSLATLVLIFSIGIRLVAMGWSIILLRRVRDWRIGLLTVMLALMTTRQGLTLWLEVGRPMAPLLSSLTELPGLAVSVLAFLAVIALAHFVTEERRTTETLHQRLRQLQALYHLADTVNRTEAVEAIYEEALSTLENTIEVDRTAILLFDPDGVMRFKAWHGLSEGYRRAVEGHSPWSPDERNPTPVLVPDAAEAPELEALRETILGEGIRGLAFIPLVHRGRLMGKFMLYYNAPHTFTEEEVRMAQTIAYHVAFAIQRKRAEEALQSRERFLALLNEITRAALEMPNLPTMAQVLADRLGKLFNADGCYITLWDEARQAPIPMAAYGTWRERYPSIEVVPGETTATASVLAAGRPLVIEDVFDSPYLSRRIAETFPDRSLLALPLIAGEEKLGAALIAFNQVHHFTPEEVRRGEQVARQIALAIAKGRLLEVERQQRELAEALREVGLALSATLDFDTILDRLLEQIDRVVPYDAANVMLVQGEQVCIARMRGYERFGEEVAREVASLCLEIATTPNLRRMIETGKPLIIPDTAADPGWVRVKASDYLRSWAGTPIIVQGEVVAFFSLDKVEPGFYRPEHAERLAAFAVQAAIAFQNARLFQESQRRAQELAGLYETALAISSVLDTEELLQRLAGQVHRLLAPDSFLVALYEPDEDALRVVLAQEKGEPAYDMLGMRRPLTEGGLTGWVMRERQSLLVGDLEKDPLPAKPWHGGCCPARSWLGVPLIARDRLIGALSIQSFRPHAFGEADRRLLESLAAQVAIALENARLFEESRRHVAQMEALHQVSQDLALLHDLDTLLRQIVERAIHLLNGETGGIYLYRPHRNVLEWAVAVGETLEQRIGTTLEWGEGLAGKVWATGEPLIVEDYATWPGRSPKWADLPATVVGVPIRWGREFLGVLVILAGSCQRRFSPDDAALLSRFAAQAAIAIQNARLLVQAQERARQVQQIMDTVPHGVALLDADHRLLMANPAARVHLALLTGEEEGSRLTHLGGRPIEELLIPIPEGPWHEVVLEGPPRYIFEVTARPMGRETGLPNGGWVLVIRDVTRQRQIQQQAQEQERLATVGQLAAGIAHDFNNILAVILLYTQMAQRDAGLPPKTARRLQVIAEQAQRAASLIQQILDFSRRSLIEPRPLDLVPFLKELTKLLDRTLPENIEVNLAYSPAPCMVNADPARLQQALINLALNARDAMPEGGRLQIGLERVRIGPGEIPPGSDMAPGEWVRIRVADTGIGIPPDVMPHIFEPFFTTKPPGEGTGLGLAQVYGIIRQHEGHIDVESRVGQGTTFTLYLPALLLPELEEPSGEAPALVRGGGETLLVVEDDQVTRQALRELLESLNYRVLEASNGREALMLFEQYGDEVALVLSDLVMPEMGGEALCQALQRRRPDVKIIVLTGYPLGEAAAELRAHGVVGWLQKPPSVERLTEVIAQALEERPS